MGHLVELAWWLGPSRFGCSKRSLHDVFEYPALKGYSDAQSERVPFLRQKDRLPSDALAELPRWIKIRVNRRGPGLIVESPNPIRSAEDCDRHPLVPLFERESLLGRYLSPRYSQKYSAKAREICLATTSPHRANGPFADARRLTGHFLSYLGRFVRLTGQSPPIGLTEFACRPRAHGSSSNT